MTEISPTGRPGMVPAGSGTKRGEWLKGCESAHCVEVLHTEDGQLSLIRSTKQPDILTFTRDEWLAFQAGADLGEFDL